MTTPLRLHPDRLLPADPSTREVARRLHAAVVDAPIISPHGHVDPELVLRDEAFPDPASTFITPDHYVTRLLHAQGVDLADLGVTDADAPVGAAPPDPRRVWRLLCHHWPALRGTPSRYWLESELAEQFGVTTRPSEETADAIYDQVAASLAEPAYRPRALFERFRIDVLATTDDPVSDLSAHRALAQDPTFPARVLPTFRADRYLDPGQEGWAAHVAALGAAAGVDTASWDGMLEALRRRRAFFAEHGATATDQGPVDTGSEPLSRAEGRRLHAAALTQGVSAAEAAAYRRAMLFESAAMAAEDGLVMQLHPGVLRGHHTPTLRRFGPDTGHDLPLPTDFVRGLRPLLERFGTSRTFRMVLFTVDETTFSRDIAPLAGFYPSVYVGAPWWFLDTPDAVLRFRAAVTDTAGFYRTAGFVDDTRAFFSIPARHDMARRLDAAFLARLVVEHRLDEDEARETLHDLVERQPREAFRL
ncbi:glucuronate isomerase [uncultured Pseudokineococcus sp.]|uniref:glucuronate isomerase n=1 Tax=uncultured Pseudokineococcus sp. TaxID=1642928 RepID=UPI0026292BB1|nr:glucuronate isomerase [uncultured Pseudokineococcus sp.]